MIITWFLTLCWRWVSCTSTQGGKSKPYIYCRKPGEFSLGQNTWLLLSFLGFSRICHFMQVANCIVVMKCSPPVRKNYKEYSMESRTQFRVHAALTKLKADTNDQDEKATLWGKMILSQWRLFSEDQSYIVTLRREPKTLCGFYAVVLPSVNQSHFFGRYYGRLYQEVRCQIYVYFSLIINRRMDIWSVNQGSSSFVL